MLAVLQCEFKVPFSAVTLVVGTMGMPTVIPHGSTYTECQILSLIHTTHRGNYCCHYQGSSSFTLCDESYVETLIQYNRLLQFVFAVHLFWILVETEANTLMMSL